MENPNEPKKPDEAKKNGPQFLKIGGGQVEEIRKNCLELWNMGFTTGYQIGHCIGRETIAEQVRKGCLN